MTKTPDELSNKFIALREGDRAFPARSAVAYFLCALMPIDGETHPMEEDRLLRIVVDDFDISKSDAEELIAHAKSMDANSSSMEAMAQILSSELEKSELLVLISHLWEMVFADGRIHESEINFVERVAGLLNIPQDEVVSVMNVSGE